MHHWRFYCCNENLWELNISAFFLQLDRCHSLENFNADDFISFIFIFHWKRNTKTQQPPKCLQWIADVKLWSKKWYAIKNWFGFRFVSFLFIVIAFVPYTKMIPNYERHIPGYLIFTFRINISTEIACRQRFIAMYN